MKWNFKWENYNPIDFTTARILSRPAYADPANPYEITKWNQQDNGIKRASHNGVYKIIDGRPQNPVGRTGVVGRGRLGRWGPNHAADAIVTRHLFKLFKFFILMFTYNLTLKTDGRKIQMENVLLILLQIKKYCNLFQF